MSHVVSIDTQIRDQQAVESACTRLNWPQPIHGKHRLFGSNVEGLGVQAPRWNYPIVCHLETGQLSIDNFNGYWGDPVHLDQFIQAYAVEKTKLEARRQGRSVTESSLADGFIQLVVEVSASDSSASDYSSQQGGAL